MLISGKLIAALIAAAITGVTGSPVEPQKREPYISYSYCLEDPLGSGDTCSTQWTAGWNECINLEDTYLDKAFISFNPYGFICILYA